MPYLKPEDALARISGFTRDELRPGIAEDREFLRDQAGSMSSTLRFLAREIEMREDVVREQAETLEASLIMARKELADIDGADAVRAAVDDALAVVQSLETLDIYERERAILDACNDVLAVIQSELIGDDARRVRRPLYDFIDTRLQLQLEILGQSSN
jgi:hypothetical protein